MKQKGQIFSLDLLVSIVLVIVALGIAMQFLELKELEAKEYTEQMELERVGNTAAELLVNNPNITCNLADSFETKIDSLSNCLTQINNINIPHGRAYGWWTAPGIQKKIKPILKEKLGIPLTFDCLITLEAPGLPADANIAVVDCIATPTNAKNVFSSTRKVVIHNTDDSVKVFKAEMYACRDNNPTTTCNLVSGTITLKVWKP